MKPVYKFLKTAREIVKTRWKKGSMGEAGGPRCALGAIHEATGMHNRNALGITIEQRAALYTNFEKGYKALAKSIEEDHEKLFNFNDYEGTITRFNDRPFTTQQQVVEAFSKALRENR